MKIEGKNRVGEGTTPVTTACPETGKLKCEKRKEKKKMCNNIVALVLCWFGKNLKVAPVVAPRHTRMQVSIETLKANQTHHKNLIKIGENFTKDLVHRKTYDMLTFFFADFGAWPWTMLTSEGFDSINGV